MEHIYTIKVKRRYDARSQYPSERRYSASTVFGFAWVHFSLACTSFLLACLALHNPVTVQPEGVLKEVDVSNATTPPAELYDNSTHEVTMEDSSSNSSSEELDMGNAQKLASNIIEEDELPEHLKRSSFVQENGFILIVSPCLLTLGGLLSGFAAMVAWRRWYIDHSITWFLLSSILSTVLSVTALAMIIIWVAAISETRFCDYFTDGSLFKKTHFETESSSEENGTLFYVIKVPLEELRNRNIPLIGEEAKHHQTRKVLSINILITAVVEFIWSLLSLKIAWCGMMSKYPDDDSSNNRGSGNTIHIVSEIKGNNTKRLPKNTKILPPKPDLLEHFPKNSKIKKIFESQQENGGLFVNTESGKENGRVLVTASSANDRPFGFSRRESSAEYRERMMNYLNKCDPSVVEPPESQADPCSLNSTESAVDVSNNDGNTSVSLSPDAGDKSKNRLSTISWGDRYDYPVYNQNNLDLEKIGIHLPKNDGEALPSEESARQEDASGDIKNRERY